MRWIPPRSLPAREQWARENRWVAGLYFGLLLSAFMTGWYRTRWPGWYAIAAGILTLPLATIGFAWYVRHMAHYNVMYGSIGASIALLVWMYLSAAVALLGCEFNAEYERLAKATL